MHEIKRAQLWEHADLKALSKHPEMQLASQNFTGVCPIIFTKAEVRDKFKLIIAFRSRRKPFTFFTFWTQLRTVVCLKVHECLILHVRSEDSHCKARLPEHAWGYWVGFSSILGVYLQVLNKHSWYLMSHSSYQSSNTTQPQEVKSSHLQSRHPTSQLHHILHTPTILTRELLTAKVA